MFSSNSYTSRFMDALHIVLVIGMAILFTVFVCGVVTKEEFLWIMGPTSLIMTVFYLQMWSLHVARIYAYASVFWLGVLLWFFAVLYKLI